jgi:hypothetical protein
MQPSVQLTHGENNVSDNINFISELIDQDTGHWKIEVVRRNFIPPEADAILNIPLRRGGGEDFWAVTL